MGDWAEELTLRAMIDDRIEDEDYEPWAIESWVPNEGPIEVEAKTEEAPPSRSTGALRTSRTS